MAEVADTCAGLLAAAGVALLMLSGGRACAGDTVRPAGPLAGAEVLAGDLLRLADGRAVRLAGIRVPAEETAEPSAQRFAEQARAALRRLLDGQSVTLDPAEAPYDRYGRLVAQVERGDGLWLQGALLERGLALVQTRPGEAARADRMLALERAARAAGRGLWAEATFMPRDAGALDGSMGRFRIVRGTVVRVAPTERYLYLNFGADWRADFTVRVRRSDLGGALAGVDLEGLAGRAVEVRGVVLEAGGPLIELSHPEQLQVLP